VIGFFGMTETWFSFSFEAEAFLTFEVLVAWLEEFLTFFFSSWEELCEEAIGTADLAFLIGLEPALTGTFLLDTTFLEAIFLAGAYVFDICVF